jgi:hypothetical protein
MASKAADVDAPGPLIDLGMAPANGNGAIYPKFSKRSWKEMGMNQNLGTLLFTPNNIK